MIHAIGAAAKFSGGLWSTKKEHAEDGDLAAVEVEDLLEPVLKLGDAAIGAARGARKALFLQCSESVPDGSLRRESSLARDYFSDCKH